VQITHAESMGRELMNTEAGMGPCPVVQITHAESMGRELTA